MTPRNWSISFFLEGVPFNLLPIVCEFILCYTHFNNWRENLAEVRDFLLGGLSGQTSTICLGLDFRLTFIPSKTIVFRKRGQMSSDKQLIGQTAG